MHIGDEHATSSPQNIQPKPASLPADLHWRGDRVGIVPRNPSVSPRSRLFGSPAVTATLSAEQRSRRRGRSLSRPARGGPPRTDSQAASPARVSRSSSSVPVVSPVIAPRTFFRRRTTPQATTAAPAPVQTSVDSSERSSDVLTPSTKSLAAALCSASDRNGSCPPTQPFAENISLPTPSSAVSLEYVACEQHKRGIPKESPVSIDGAANRTPAPPVFLPCKPLSRATGDSPDTRRPFPRGGASLRTPPPAALSPREANVMGNRPSNSKTPPRAAARAYDSTGDDSFFSASSRAVTPRRQSAAVNATEATPQPPSLARKEKDGKDADWSFKAPPSSQRTFFFPEDKIEFSSEFDGGNLIQMERVGAFKYNMYSAMDCSTDERQTNNRQWFHFSVRGGAKGATVSVTVVGLMHCNMYTYEWMPVMAVLPSRPAYMRLPGKAATTALDAVPATPGYPMLVYRDPAERRRALEGSGDADDGAADAEDEAAGEDGDDDNAATSPVDQNSRADKDKDKAKKKKKKPAAMDVMFDFRLDYEIPLTSPHPLGHPDCPAMYIASNHPYAYSTLQSNLRTWQRLAASRAGVGTSAIPATAAVGKGPHAKVWNYTPNFANGHQQDIYFHREVLCKSLEGRNVDLITITDMNGIQGGARDTAETMPMLTFNGEQTPIGFPHSSAHHQSARPRRFVGKQYVVLSARVHAGECPGSHVMHGCIEFLMNAKDPRAIALRRNFVFFLVPMLNPDGVVRGHSRVDANGVDLNRMYRAPSYKRHPAAYSLWALLSTLAAERKLALYVDMHAHANKRGTFFYANGMDAASQVENLLYSKLVSMNTPYLEFRSCNYSESNMSAVTRSGLSKDCSCRVVLFTEAGVLHSYAIEASYVAGKALNPVVPLAGIPGEEVETIASMRYTPATFNDTGKAILLALLDLKGLNPVSRVPLSPFLTVKGIALWIQRQLQIELAEKLFAIAFKESGLVEPEDATQSLYAAVLAQLTPEVTPEKITVRGCRHLPPTTVGNYEDFIPRELASTLLAQTPPTGPPRSLMCTPPPQSRRKTTPAARPTAAAPAASPVAEAAPFYFSGLAEQPTAGRPQPVMAQPVGIAAGPGKKRSVSQRSRDSSSGPVDEIAEAVREAAGTR